MHEVIVREAAVSLGIWNNGILLAGLWQDLPHQSHRMQLSPIQGTPFPASNCLSPSFSSSS
jgi:hypothetical protein